MFKYQDLVNSTIGSQVSQPACTGELIYWTQDSWTFSGPNPAGAKNPLLLVGGGTDGFSQIILGG
jgi:hypothetical protein